MAIVIDGLGFAAVATVLSALIAGTFVVVKARFDLELKAMEIKQQGRVQSHIEEKDLDTKTQALLKNAVDIQERETRRANENETRWRTERDRADVLDTELRKIKERCKNRCHLPMLPTGTEVTFSAGSEGDAKLGDLPEETKTL